MKEVVISYKKLDLTIDEENFIFFFVKPLFLLFIYFGIYSRYSGFFGLTGGQTTVLISFGLFAAAVFHMIFIKRDLRLSNFAGFISVFFILSGVFPFFAVFVFQSAPTTILRYSIEIAITFFMFFSIYYFIREKIISPKFFIYSLALLGALAAFKYLTALVGQLTIYRIQGLSGLNTLGTSFSLAAFTWVLILYNYSETKPLKIKRIAAYCCFTVVMLGMLFTGTRSAIISLVAGLFLFQYLGMKSKKFKRYVIYGMIVLGIILVVFALNFNIAFLLDRFSWTNITRMAGIRFTIYSKSITDLTFLDFIFGRPDFYIFSNKADDFINPHNLFLATIRYNGIILFIILIFIFLIFFYKYAALYKIHKHERKYRIFETSIIILFVMVVIYTMFSGGRTTRSFNFFITLGYAVGYFEMLKTLKTYDEYEELIL